MMNRANWAVWATVLGAGVGIAGASDCPFGLAIQNSSSATVDACLTTAIGERCDADSVGILGSGVFSFDDSDNPQQIWIHDLSAVSTSNLSLVFDYGFLGSLTFTFSIITVEYATPGVATGPASVSPGAGSFFLMDVPLVVNGSGSYQGTGVLSGFSGDASLDNVMQMTTLEGNAFAGGGSATVLINGFIHDERDIQGNLVVSDIAVNATLVGQTPCRADLDCDGLVNGIDVGLFLSAYAAGNLEADFNGDGMVNGIDVGLFLSAYAGCLT